MTEFKMSIMGVMYKVQVGTRAELGMSDSDQGSTRFYSHEIQICNEAEGFTPSELKRVVRETMIHELAHAYLYECGHVRLADDEEVDEWLSVVFDHIVSSVEEFDKKVNKS